MAFCTNCGSQLPEGANNCTNCGAPTGATASAAAPAAEPVTATAPEAAPAAVNAAPSEAGKGMAIASLVCGLVALFCTGGILSVLALIFGIIAKKQGSKSGMATAGIVLGAIGIALIVIGVIIGIIAGIGAAASISEYGGYYYY